MLIHYGAHFSPSAPPPVVPSAAYLRSEDFTPHAEAEREAAQANRRPQLVTVIRIPAPAVAVPFLPVREDLTPLVVIPPPLPVVIIPAYLYRISKRRLTAGSSGTAAGSSVLTPKRRIVAASAGTSSGVTPLTQRSGFIIRLFEEDYRPLIPRPPPLPDQLPVPPYTYRISRRRLLGAAAGAAAGFAQLTKITPVLPLLPPAEDLVPLLPPVPPIPVTDDPLYRYRISRRRLVGASAGSAGGFGLLRAVRALAGASGGSASGKGNVNAAAPVPFTPAWFVEDLTPLIPAPVWYPRALTTLLRAANFKTIQRQAAGAGTSAGAAALHGRLRLAGAAAGSGSGFAFLGAARIFAHCAGSSSGVAALRARRPLAAASAGSSVGLVKSVPPAPFLPSLFREDTTPLIPEAIEPRRQLVTVIPATPGVPPAPPISPAAYHRAEDRAALFPVQDGADPRDDIIVIAYPFSIIRAHGGGSSEGTASLMVRRRLLARSGGSSSGVATAVTRVGLSGLGAGSSAGAADLRVRRAVRAQVAGSGAGAANLIRKGPVAVVAGGAGSSGSHAELHARRRSLAVRAAGSAAGVGDLRVRRAIRAAGAGAGAGSGGLGVVRPLAGAGAGSSAGFAVALTRVGSGALGAGSSAGVAGLHGRRAVRAATAGTGGGFGDLRSVTRILAAAGGSAAGFGNLGIRRRVVAVGGGSSAGVAIIRTLRAIFASGAGSSSGIVATSTAIGVTGKVYEATVTALTLDEATVTALACDEATVTALVVDEETIIMPTLGDTFTGYVVGDAFKIRRTIDWALSKFAAGTTITKAWLVVKRRKSDLDTAALVEKIITTSDVPGTGEIEVDGSGDVDMVVRFDLEAADTQAIGTRPKVFDLQVLTAGGKVHTVWEGRIWGIGEVTIATS